MAYTAVLSANFGSYQPTLGDVRISVDGQTISSGITAIADSNGAGFQATVATMTDGFRGPFTFYDSTDATKFCVGAVGPEHEQLDSKISTRSSHDAAAVRAEMDSNSTQLAAIVADTNELQSDDIPALISVVSTKVDTAQADLDIVTGADGVNLLSGTQASIDAIEADTNELQTDDVPTLISGLDTKIDTVDGVVDAILVDTDTTIPASIAALPTAAITADAVWDEATADHTSAGTFGLLMSTVATASAVAQAVWEYTSRTLTMTVNAYSALTGASRIRIVRFVTFANTWSGITVPPTWSKCYFTLKLDPDDESDTAAIVQIVVTNGGDASDGLQRINGGAATANQASIVVNEGGGTVAVTISDDATSLIDVADNLSYDIKFVNTGSDSQIPFVDSYCDVVSTATRSI